jgi:hypothetical protein
MFVINGFIFAAKISILTNLGLTLSIFLLEVIEAGLYSLIFVWEILDQFF